ncbi:RAM signaling pathway protein [Colletotrichum paranaense]|uniref:RAM signaling pathway protein n=3 Tax=Colletotrichum acutatum species complex TaxID=2707335 RepID=A0AAI9UM84_9PEZI|nr:RAM signaling pathway protein [Colletotrichum paranaense]KAK0371969.1 RAM signaling pathway protein [Colletotrichum limetticola]KAK1459706.1 RAM signaling pathway protein [Colletotrichum melonis]KAK1544499.1 RAM signaling pathway protein [Colletotrichum paranaense]
MVERMERPDRPSGPPMPRGLPENPAQGRRQLQKDAALGNIPPPPPLPPMPKDLRNLSTGASLSASSPMTSAQVIALARDAMQSALHENESQAAEASAVSNELKPGVTIDLSRKGIQKLPDEVVDIIKNELERLALSHNQVNSFPARFSECTSLRYLNVRNNQIREFPLPLCDLRSLEILDLSKNKLRALPPDIVKLASLKVFSVQKNRIEELPVALSDMVSLQVLKFDGNPITFPPREVLQVQASSPPNEGYLKESEVTEVAVTAHIKRFLRQHAMNGRAESDTAGEESSEGVETPRMPPIKRVVSGRFPIKVNGTDVPDLRSPNLIRPPPIPNRSHYRGLSQQNTAVRRPGVMPLTIGNVNERLRSNSETLLQATRGERPESRARRMGVVSQKATQLGTLDETQANNRFSHYRGLSHGSAMQPPPPSMSVKSPNSPAEPFLQRPIYVRRLSVLPERRRESKFYDPILEAAKGILYAVFQIHPMIQMLMSLTSDGSSKRSSLEIVFYNTNSHVEELEQEIQKHDPMVVGDEMAGRDNENVHRACQTLVGAYTHVCTLLAGNIDSFVDNGDPRYIRTLLMLIYNSIMEIRCTLAALTPEAGLTKPPTRAMNISDTIKPHSRDNSITPTADRLGWAQRPRPGPIMHNPSNLRVATDVPLPYLNGISGMNGMNGMNGNVASRTAMLTSATPRSGESFASASSGGRGISDFTEDDRHFERIFLALRESSEVVSRTLPAFQSHMSVLAKRAMGRRAPEHEMKWWKALISRCSTALQQTEMLQSRLSLIKLKEPGLMNQPAFRNLISNFMDSWYEFGDHIRKAISEVSLPLPPDTRNRLRPIQHAMKQATDTIVQSPWGYLLRQSSNSNMFSPNSGPGLAPMQLPMTPQSAALGPAVQATVPSTPQSASFASAFNGGVFERADALISMGGLSMSRNGTMTNSSAASFTMSSMSSLSSDGGAMTPSSVISPNGFGPGPVPLRLNGSKVAF